MAQGQIELADETAGAEGGELLAERDNLLLQSQGRLAGLEMRRTREFDQATRPLLLIAAQPFTDGGNGGLK